MSPPSDYPFSIRRLNPFAGVLQIFQSGDARALSDTGRSWEIQVLSDTPQGLWANTPFSGRRYYTFGLWSPAGGLEQVPVNPLFNIRQMITAAERLLERLEPACRDLPFPLEDRYERWLLDGPTGQPIALLESRRSGETLTDEKGTQWIACADDDLAFVSTELSRENVAIDDADPRRHAALLESAINQRAGSRPLSRWFERQTDGSAIACNHQEACYDADYFPELLLTQDWEQPAQSGLIQNYLDWKAPQLLTLHNLRDETRERLEKTAINQAESVARLWRLYPQIHNHDLLKSARVEAKIRLANRN